MGQVTLYLDTETEQALKATARAENLSLSRWVGRLIQGHLQNEWPRSIAELAGAWKDFPEVEELRADLGEDVPREPI